MAENENRSIFALNGLTGLLLAVVLLLVIEITLVTVGLGVQQDQAENYYDLKKEQLQMHNADNAALKFDAK